MNHDRVDQTRPHALGAHHLPTQLVICCMLLCGSAAGPLRCLASKMWAAAAECWLLHRSCTARARRRSTGGTSRPPSRDLRGPDECPSQLTASLNVKIPRRRCKVTTPNAPNFYVCTSPAPPMPAPEGTPQRDPPFWGEATLASLCPFVSCHIKLLHIAQACPQAGAGGAQHTNPSPQHYSWRSRHVQAL